MALVPASVASAGDDWSVAGGVRFEPAGAGGAGAGAGLTVVGTGTYRGAIEVRRNGGALSVVNVLALEDYIKGIDEVPSGWPAAALQAQAIAARTYALNRAASTEATPWRAVGADICASATCQVYRGMTAERRAGGSAWLAAVDATAGRVLLSGGRPIFASYSATANGPLAMSQNGAYAMALEGRTASDILAASYGGVRPTTLGPGQLPATIRVALATAVGSARVSSSGPSVRATDGGGVDLGTSAGGEWRVLPGSGGVKVAPPDTVGRHSSPAVSALPALPSDVAAADRRPGRVVIAASPLPHRGPWTLVAGTLVVAAAVGAVATLPRRRRG